MVEDQGAPTASDGLSSVGSSPQAVSPANAASIPSAFAGVARMVPADLVWAYQAELRDGRLYHRWSIVGPRGGIHVHAWDTMFRGHEWLGGIEAHSPIRQSDYASQEPSQEHCWLLDGPCWHDGSSLQFSEQIAPCLPRPNDEMTASEHQTVTRVMLHRYDLWLPSAQAIEARSGETEGLDPKGESAVAKPCAQGDGK